MHIILPDHFSPDNMGLIIPKTRDGRVLFFLPWEGEYKCYLFVPPECFTLYHTIKAITYLPSLVPLVLQA